METYIPVIIQSIIVGGVGYLFTNAVTKVNNKLDLVLKNQEDHRVDMTRMEKDVESNKEWSQELRDKVNSHDQKINKLMTDVAGLVAHQK